MAAGIVFLLLAGCAAEAPPSIPSPSATTTLTPTRTLRPSPTITPTPSITPTATPHPLPPPITQDNLSELSLLYRFNSLGFYLPDRDWLVLYDNQQTALWDLRSGGVLATFIGRYKTLHGDYLLTTTDSDLLLWQVSTGEQLRAFSARQGEFHLDQPWLVVYDTDAGSAQVWEYQTGKLLGELVEYPQDHFRFSPGGGLLAASGGPEMLVRVWALPDLEVAAQFDQHVRAGNSNTRIEFTADDRYLLVTGTEEQKIFDLQTEELVWVNAEAWEILLGPDADVILVTSEATTRIYDLSAEAYRSRYLLGDTPAYFPEVGLITNHDASVMGFNLYVYDAESFEAVTTLYLPRGVSGNGSFNPDAGLFTTPDQSGLLRFFDLTTWEQVGELEGMQDFYIVRPEFSRGGNWLLFGWYTYDEHGDYFNGFDVWGIPQ